jgi:Spy/CpxP family protein refolding chaperone
MKRNKMLTITAVIVALLLTIGTGYSIAKGGLGMHGPGMFHRAPLLKCIDKLTLSAETKTAINTLVQNNRAANKQSWESNQATMKTLYTNYAKALTAYPMDQAAQDALTAAQNAIITQMQANVQEGIQRRFELNSAIVAKLTPEELATVGTCFESEIQNKGMHGMGEAE